MLPPSRGRVIFCNSRDNDGACGVIHRRNVITSSASFVSDKSNVESEALLTEACQLPVAGEPELLAECQPVKNRSSSQRRRHVLPKLFGNPGHGTPTAEQHFPATPSQISIRPMPSTPDPLQTPIRMITPDHFCSATCCCVRSTPDTQLRPSRASTCTPDHSSFPSQAGTCTPDHMPNPCRVDALKSDHLSNLAEAQASTVDHRAHPARFHTSKSDHALHPSRPGASTPDDQSQPSPINISRPDYASHHFRIDAPKSDHPSHPSRTDASTPDHISHPSRTSTSTPDHATHHSRINASAPEDHPSHPSQTGASAPDHASHLSQINAASSGHSSHPFDNNTIMPAQMAHPSQVCASKSDHLSNFTEVKALTPDHVSHPASTCASMPDNMSHLTETNASTSDDLPYLSSQREAPSPAHVPRPQHHATLSTPNNLASAHENALTADNSSLSEASAPDQLSCTKVPVVEPDFKLANDEPKLEFASPSQMPSGRPPRPDSGDGVLQLKGLRNVGSPLNDQVVCSRYAARPLEGAPSRASGEKGRYKKVYTPGAIRTQDHVSPKDFRPPSMAGTPLSGLPLSPEHEVFRHLSESPSSNSVPGRRCSYLDLKSWKQGEMLGRGSSGEVYKAMCGGQFLAVKKIRLKAGTRSTSAKEAEELRAEIELLQQLNHPRIVRYMGCLLEELECGGLNLLIFLEYMPSGSLSSVMKKFGPYGLPLAKKYTRQILEGLAFLHSKGIVHRDVKGANVLVDHMGEAKLADFGACKQLEALHSTLSGGLCEVKGSVFWMAPEMVTGTAGRRSDIWSAGCVVIEMLTARPPWTLHRNVKNWSLPQALQYIMESNEIPPIPENCDPKCHDFLIQCLVREHRKRPYAYKLLSHEFLRVEEKQ